MSDTKHTPGPWMVEPINDGETYQITTTEASGFVVIAETPLDPAGQDLANAQLMAAAPALHDALAWIVEFIGEHPDWWGDDSEDCSENEWLHNARTLLNNDKDVSQCTDPGKS